METRSTTRQSKSESKLDSCRSVWILLPQLPHHLGLQRFSPTRPWYQLKFDARGFDPGAEVASFESADRRDNSERAYGIR